MRRKDRTNKRIKHPFNMFEMNKKTRISLHRPTLALFCIVLFVLAAPQVILAQTTTNTQTGINFDPSLFQFIRVKHESGRIPAFAFYSFFRNGMEPWAHDYPTAEQNMYDMIERLTQVGVTHKTKILTLDSDEIFNYPLLYICEIGYWNLRDELAVRLGEYLKRGGFMIVDDFRLAEEMNNLRQQLKKAVPDFKIEKLNSSHPIFNCFFEFPYLPMDTPYYRYGDPIYYGMFDENGRLAAIINYNNDIGDGWEMATAANFRLESYKLGINYFIYSMTH